MCLGLAKSWQMTTDMSWYFAESHSAQLLLNIYNLFVKFGTVMPNPASINVLLNTYHG